MSLLIFGTAAGAKEPAETWIRGIFTGKSPRAVEVAEKEAWQRANRMADHTPQAFVLVGTGRSMQPLYRPGTILVLQKFPFELLERGQTVVYRNELGKVVAHVLVAKGRDGWRASGLNNSRHDMEPVVAGNLVGVVVGAFQPMRTRQVHLATLAP